ncbi:MAG TPA: ABC transporter permease [Nocardioides sp.]|uniref:ABC transporter permease n=1 Tax=Nocardioides sp. TaxID=35761 RepID=UPI002CC085BD|nr:ABC transporter permease [Nocardioides sp.]HQR25717.1 ABC transporter permease [Nocardioides sp.]
MSIAHLGPGPTAPAAAVPEPPKRRGWVGYALLLPAALWLLVFFVIPLVQLVATSLYDPAGTLESGYDMTWHWQNYQTIFNDYMKLDPWYDVTSSPFGRAMVYSGIATLACILLGYPLAYAIAFKAGRWKNLMLVAVIAPFFTSFLVRTLSWQLILSDEGFFMQVLNTLHITDLLEALHIAGSEGNLLATPFAVVTGLTYNFLPFLVLPLYASLEKIDPRLLEAGADLYASPFTTFRKVTLPLSMPGLVAGTLLTFIPAAGDFINAELLGNPTTQMVGNVIQNLFNGGSYPDAAALSVALMVIIVVLVLAYIRRAGTEELV